MTVYSATVVHAKLPYQIALVDLLDGTRVMGRIDGDPVAIGDHVVELEPREGVRYFRKG
jgi:uncharacterized OB-fold protein